VRARSEQLLRDDNCNRKQTNHVRKHVVMAETVGKAHQRCR